MIGYICKYTPVEIFQSLGVEIKRIEPKVSNFHQADTYMHSNMCSFVKSVLEDVMDNDYEGIILTTCCDSVRRLYDTLVHQFPDKFIYLLDLPRKVNDFAATLYEKQLQEMIDAYKKFNPEAFQKLSTPESSTETKDDASCFEKNLLAFTNRQHLATGLKFAPKQDYDLRIGLAGARPGNDIRNMLENLKVEVVFDLTCTGINRDYVLDDEQILNSYAKALLNQMPCMRMMEATNRHNFIQGMKDQVDGIIYHTIKFCDIYSFEYHTLRDNPQIPVVAVETDATAQCSGQILTRVEAFLESLRASKGMEQTKFKEKKLEDGHMYVLGIDSGSTSTNAVLLDDEKKIRAFAVVRTGAKSNDSADKILEQVLEAVGIKQEDLSCICATGYGRVSIPFADTNVTEISCHGKGAHYLNPAVRTILDIGGQDSKAIKLNEQGEVVDFVMNDKCAAGTGRFLEMMARTLEISIDELGPISLNWKEDIDISSMCSVFAESEVISLIAQNKETADIAHGLHKAIAGKSISLLKRVGLESTIMMTGGVAKNVGVIKTLEERLGEKIFIYEEPEIVGALGAALYALEKIQAE